MRTSVVAAVASLVLFVGVLTVVRADGATVDLEVADELTGAWVTAWDVAEAVLPRPGTCDPVAECRAWLVAEVDDRRVRVTDDTGLLDAPIVQLAVQGPDGAAGTLARDPRALVAPELMGPVSVETRGRTLALAWEVPTTDRTLTEVVACGVTAPCYVVASTTRSSARVTDDSIARLVPNGVEVRRLEVRVATDTEWWWSDPRTGELPRPVTGTRGGEDG